jgi:hypothetical protein
VTTVSSSVPAPHALLPHPSSPTPPICQCLEPSGPCCCSPPALSLQTPMLQPSSPTPHCECLQPSGPAAQQPHTPL